MKRLSLVVASLLFVAFAGFGCAGMKSGSDGWTTLINGDKGLENWDRYGDANWRAEKGTILADKKTGKPAGFLMTKKSYKDFQLKVEFWVSNDANSGIYMRCSDLKNIKDTTCYEANIFDQRKEQKYATGAIVHISPVSPVPLAGGKWNVFDITVKGDHMVVIMNGVKTADAHDAKLKSGPIGLQYAAGVVKFRKFQIKEL